MIPRAEINSLDAQIEHGYSLACRSLGESESALQAFKRWSRSRPRQLLCRYSQVPATCRQIERCAWHPAQRICFVVAPMVDSTHVARLGRPVGVYRVPVGAHNAFTNPWSCVKFDLREGGPDSASAVLPRMWSSGRISMLRVANDPRSCAARRQVPRTLRGLDGRR